MDAALSVLKVSGVEGLTMRGVAATAGRSLNNIQHHFKNKQVLLNALTEHYFDQCNDTLQQYSPGKLPTDPKQELYNLILFALKQTEQINDTCIVFRELWAVSMRDREVEDKLNQFYSASVEKLCSFWEQYDENNAAHAATILLPYIEGYSIQHKALPITTDEIAKMLTDTIYSVLTREITEESSTITSEVTGQASVT